MSTNDSTQQSASARTPIDLPRGASQLLGFVAQSDLVEFENLTSSASLAPTLKARLTVAGLAAAQFSRFQKICEQLYAQRLPIDASLQPFCDPLDAFSQSMQTQTWVGAQLRAVLVTGLRLDFISRITPGLSSELAELLTPGPAAWRISDFGGRVVHQTLDDDPDAAGTLALYGRRLAAEVVGQCQRIASREVELTGLIAHALSAAAQQDDGNTPEQTVSEPGNDLEAVSGLLEDLMASHTRRLARLGLGA